MARKSEFLDVRVVGLPGKLHIDKWENIAKEIILAITGMRELGIAEDKISISPDGDHKETEKAGEIEITIGGFFMEANYPQTMQRILLSRMVSNVAGAVDPFFPKTKIICSIDTVCQGKKCSVTLFPKPD